MSPRRRTLLKRYGDARIDEWRAENDKREIE